MQSDFKLALDLWFRHRRGTNVATPFHLAKRNPKRLKEQQRGQSSITDDSLRVCPVLCGSAYQGSEGSARLNHSQDIDTGYRTCDWGRRRTPTKEKSPDGNFSTLLPLFFLRQTADKKTRPSFSKHWFLLRQTRKVTGKF